MASTKESNLIEMECPRCGFQQPPDRYCANCGLDIEIFNRKPQPIFKKILKNPFLNLAIVTFVLLAILYQLQKQSPSLPMTAEQIVSSNAIDDTPTAPPETFPPSEPAVPPPAADLNVTDSLPQGLPTPTTAETTPSATETAAVISPEKSTAAEKALTPPANIEISFLEVPRDLLNTIFTESLVLQDSAQVRAVQFPDKNKYESMIAVARKLNGDKRSGLKMHSPMNLNFGRKDSHPNMMVEIVPIKFAPGSVDLDISMSFKFDNDSPAQQFTESLIAKTNTLLLIAGLIPHKAVAESTEKAWLSTPMGILASPDFTENLSEFVMQVEVK